MYFQEIFNSIDYSPIQTTDYKKVQQITSKLDKKLTKVADLFQKISHIFNETNGTYETVITSCKPNETIDQKTEIVDFIKKQKNHLNDFIYKIKEQSLTTKNEWFLSASDLSSKDCLNQFDDNYIRSLYISSIRAKCVIILINNGRSSSDDQLNLSKAIGRFIVEMLGEGDRIGVITIADTAKPYKDVCGGADLEMYSTDSISKKKIIKFIDQIDLINEATRHSIGFEASFKMLQNNLIGNETRPTMIVYLSPSIRNEQNIFETILIGQKTMFQPVVVHTIEIMSDEKKNKNILSEISTGFYKIIDRNDNRLIKKILTEIFTVFFIKKFIDNKLVLHPPVINANDVIVSMTQTIENFGIFGIDLYLSDLVEDITSHNRYRNSYAFMIDLNGMTIIHPLLSRPSAPTHIQYLESNQFNRKIFENMTFLLEGNETIYEGKQLVSSGSAMSFSER